MNGDEDQKAVGEAIRDLDDHANPDMAEAVLAFMLAYGQPVDVPMWATKDPRLQGVIALRKALIHEEATELLTAMDNHDVVGVADSIADLLYVVFGAVVEWGIPIYAVFDAVHKANMAKMHRCGDCGKATVLRREDGKIMKPKGWQPPDIAAVLRGRTAGALCEVTGCAAPSTATSTLCSVHYAQAAGRLAAGEKP